MVLGIIISTWYITSTRREGIWKHEADDTKCRWRDLDTEIYITRITNMTIFVCRPYIFVAIQGAEIVYPSNTRIHIDERLLLLLRTTNDERPP